MQFRQSACQRQPKAGALVTAAEPGIYLTERLQRDLDLSLAHADTGVAHFKCDGVGPGLAHGDDDRSAGLGELDGVGQQIEQNLLQPHRIGDRSEEHTSELQSLAYLVCRLLLEKKKKTFIALVNNKKSINSQK